MAVLRSIAVLLNTRAGQLDYKVFGSNELMSLKRWQAGMGGDLNGFLWGRIGKQKIESLLRITPKRL